MKLFIAIFSVYIITIHGLGEHEDEYHISDGFPHTRKLSSGPIFVLDSCTLLIHNFRVMNPKQFKYFIRAFRKNDHYNAVNLFYADDEHHGEVAVIGTDMESTNVYLSLSQQMDKNCSVDMTMLETLVIQDALDKIIASVPLSNETELMDYIKPSNPLRNEHDEFIFRFPLCGETFERAGDLIVNGTLKLAMPAGSQHRKIEYRPFKVDLWPSAVYLTKADNCTINLNASLVCDLPRIGPFCVQLKTDNTGKEVLVFGRTPDSIDKNTIKMLSFLYYAGLASSLIALLLITVIFFIKDARTKRGSIMIGFSLTMAAAFICLIIGKFLLPAENSCKNTYFAYQMLFLTAHVFNFFLIYENYYQLRNMENRQYCKVRQVFYWILVPVITVLLWLVCTTLQESTEDDHSSNNTSFPVGERNTNFKSCWFNGQTDPIPSSQPVIIIDAASICMAVLGWMQIQQRKAKSCHWKVVGHDLYMCYGLNVWATVILIIAWVNEVLPHYWNDDSKMLIFLYVVGTLQGVFMFIIFICHDPVKNEVVHLIKQRLKRYNSTYNEYV